MNDFQMNAFQLGVQYADLYGSESDPFETSGYECDKIYHGDKESFMITLGFFWISDADDSCIWKIAATIFRSGIVLPTKAWTSRQVGRARELLFLNMIGIGDHDFLTKLITEYTNTIIFPASRSEQNDYFLKIDNPTIKGGFLEAIQPIFSL